MDIVTEVKGVVESNPKNFKCLVVVSTNDSPDESLKVTLGKRFANADCVSAALKSTPNETNDAGWVAMMLGSADRRCR